jgi:predicted RNase H-like nuclease (RuvC/YqgF family)
MSEEVRAISHSAPRPRAGSLTSGIVIIATLAALAGYAFYEHRVCQQLHAQNQALAASLAGTRARIDELNAKLNGLAEETSRKPAASHPTQKLEGQVREQGKQIESTRQDLSSTRTALQGSIARTHDELVLLEKKGERAYFEFDLDKSSQFQKDGPVGVRLRKANTKHQYADLELMVDDHKVSKKHVNIFEPVVFYTPGNQWPFELVVNAIRKNHIHGYLSEAKYESSDLEAMTGATSDSATANSRAKPSPQRQHLELPKSDEN